jgi:hypothetical protein
MPRSVIIATASAGLALTFTALLATPSMAMSFTDYDANAYSPGNHVSVQSLAANRLNAAARKRDREAVLLETLREARGSAASLPVAPRAADAPFTFTLPFGSR